MNVKCPYCGCCYELGTDILKNPIGNEKLGYGWWLRCYRCKRKWWLKNTAVEMAMNTPIKVDKSAKIRRISELSRNSRKTHPSDAKRYVGLWKYVALLLFIGGILLCYQNRTIFYDFLIKKAKYLSESVVNKVAMSDVKYEVTLGNMLTVTGDILNYDERVIARVNGVKISVYDDKSLVLAWNNEFENMQILPQQKVPFSVNKQLPGDIKDIRVEVSIF